MYDIFGFHFYFDAKMREKIGKCKKNPIFLLKEKNLESAHIFQRGYKTLFLSHVCNKIVIKFKQIFGFFCIFLPSNVRLFNL